ncbi:MAG TPA: TetR family transcriptional regulator [Solirubrobacteraceae bacterium]|jgi:TetR/AcrR family transcriptional regulator|nr:TetR family transcriptional regulator [Solirubrobacteraceae bacterium]
MSSAAPRTPRRRDADVSRGAILDAAEHLFSQFGYERATLSEISRLAGVSTGLPTYFFGGKDNLYRAVLGRLIVEREARLEPLAERAVRSFESTGERRAALELLISGYVDFLRERLALVRLMGREALDGGRHLGAGPRHSAAVADAIERIAGTSSGDVDQLVITTVALCFFPFEHNDTMLAAMGRDAMSEDFAAARKRHVVDVLERVLGAG